jgi:hypothetical protein
MNKYFIVLLGILLAFNLVAAEYDITDSSFGTVYPQNTYLSGWIDISFENQSLNSIFSDSLDNEISLEQMLNKSPNYIYSCQNNNCEISYSSKNPSTTKSFSLGNDNEEFMGIVFTGNIEEITSVKFNLSSNALESEENQIRIDILNDGKIDAGNTKVGTQISNKENYGCFDDDELLEEVNIGINTFCQKVELDEAPAFFIGAWIKEITSGEINITMELYYETVPIGSCLIDEDEITTTGGEVFCRVDVPVVQKENYYICMSTEGTGEYKTIGYASTNPDNNCGFIGVPVKNEISSYRIGAKGINYGPVGTIEISNNLPNGDKISDLIEEYIEETYGSLDCTGISCQVPIRLISSTAQNININSIEIKYDKVGLPGIQSNNFYDFELEPGVINSNSQKLYLDNLFKLSSEIEDFDYTLEFDGEEIFDDKLSIKEISVMLYPLTAASNFPITFQISIYPEFEFSSYKWDFGDGGIETSVGNQKSHTYTTIGNYTLNVVAITKDNSEFSKSFEISVELPEKMINDLIKELENKISTLKQQMLLLGTFEKDQLYKRINLDEIELNLSYIKEDMKIANKDSEYKQIIDQLLLLKIPQSIIQTSTNQIFFYPQKSNINLNILEEITQETSGVAEDTINSILIWNQNNLNSKISMKEILVKWDKDFLH